MHGRVLRVTAALGVLAAVASGAGCRSGDGAPPVAAGPPSVSASTPAPGPSPTVSPSPVPSATGRPTDTQVAVLRLGDTGPAVLALQQRLVAAGFWLGTPDGRYGPSTLHAVTALQKASGLQRDGLAGPTTLAAVARVARPEPRSSTGRVVEVDLSRQLLLYVVDGRVMWVFDTSTGRVAGTTPRGHFRVSWAVDGYHRSPLGVLYRPRFFVGGVAVHGYPSVPPYPASHGCVRVTNAAMDWLWANDVLPLGGAVWVY